MGKAQIGFGEKDRSFQYIGQKSRLEQHTYFNTLVTEISGLRDNNPQNYSITTNIGRGEQIGEGYVEVREYADGQPKILNRVTNVGKSKINWENGVIAHFRTIERLVQGKKVEDLDIASDLWTLDSE